MKFFGKYAFQWKENIKLSIRTYLHNKVFKIENGESVYIAPDSIKNNIWEFLDTYVLAPSVESDYDINDYDYDYDDSDSESDNEVDIHDYIKSNIYDDNQIQTILEGFKKKKKKKKKKEEEEEEEEEGNEGEGEQKEGKGDEEEEK
jgi:hypothetical protein